MKKYRKQSVYVFGRKRLVDVPIDGELYKSDNREEYQRARSKAKHISLDEIILADYTADVMEAYEEAQLLMCLREALQTLSKKERLLIKCIYYDGLTQQKTAAILMVSQQYVSKHHEKIIQKLRNCLIDWL
jgi:RNA polymerase sigma factor (sigma-70 family)